jgi:hypothetical protein
MNNYKDVYQNLMNIMNSISDIQKLQISALRTPLDRNIDMNNYNIINGNNIITNNLSTGILSTNSITTNYPNGLTISGNGYNTTSGTSPLLTVSGQQTGNSAYANDMFKVNNDGSVVVGSYDRIISGSTVPALTVYGSIDIEDGFINAPNIISSISSDSSIAIKGTYANKRISIANPLPTLNNTFGTISSLYSMSGTIGSLNVSNGSFSTLYSGSKTVGSLNVSNGTFSTLYSGSGTIGSLNVSNGTFSTLYSGSGTIGSLNVSNGTFSTLYSGSGTIDSLNVSNGTFSTLYSGSGTIGSLNVSNGTFSTLYSGSGTIGSLNVSNGTFSTLYSGSGTIDSLNVSNGSFSTLYSGSKTVGSLIVNNGSFSTLYSGSGTIGSLNVSNGTFSTLYSGSGTIGSLNVSNGTFSTITGLSLQAPTHIFTGTGNITASIVRPNAGDSYTLTLPSGLPETAGVPLISNITGALSYNNQALSTLDDVNFNSVNIASGQSYKINNVALSIPNQALSTSDDVNFKSVNIALGQSYKINNVALSIPNQAVNTTSNVQFSSIYSGSGTIGSLNVSNGTFSTLYSGSGTIGSLNVSNGTFSTITGLSLQARTHIFTGTGNITASIVRPDAGSSYTLTLPSVLPVTAGIPLISNTTGVLSYNNQAVNTTSNVQFSSIYAKNSESWLGYDGDKRNYIRGGTFLTGGIIGEGGDFSKAMTIDRDGNVTITGKLNVTGEINGASFGRFTSDGTWDSGFALQYGGKKWVFTDEGYFFCQAYGGAISILGWGNYLAQRCDRRIKENIIDADSNDILDKINQLSMQKYNFTDKRYYNGNTVYGLIAQDVKEVFPEAVNITKHHIPNINKDVSSIVAEEYTVILTLNDFTVKVNDYLYLVVNDKPIFVKVLAFSDTTITVNKWAQYNDNDKVSVYGTTTDDFHTLDASYLGILSFGGIQELTKQNNELKARIEKLEKLLTK